MLQEIRHAFRLLGRNPGFTAIAALSLALGIGANSAIFSLADALLLRPLPIVEPSHVVTVSTDRPNQPFGIGGVSYPDYRDFRAKSQSFEGMAALQLSTFGMAKSVRETPQLRAGVMVSDNFLQVMGVQPVLGRGFLPEEGQVPGRDPVMVLSYDFWRNEFGGQRSILNSTVRINGIDFTIIGVAPKSFTGVDQYVRPHFYLPLMMWQRLNALPKNPLEDRGDHAFNVKARLKPGVSREQARAELATLWKNLAPLQSEADRNRVLGVRTEFQARVQGSPFDAYLVGMLMALVAVVLMIACANVANLLLGRAQARTREIAIRMALGISRTRLVRQLMIESLLLSLIGAAAGLMFAYGGIRFLQNVPIPTDIPVVIDPQLDHRVLLFSLFAAIASALIFGLVPALRTSRSNLIPALKNAEPGAGVRRRMLGRNTLVVAQIALAMVLLVATGALIDSFRKILFFNPGFRTDHILNMETDTSLVRYTPEQTREFYKNFLDKARALPGIRAAALASVIPFAPGQGTETFVPEGYQFTQGETNASAFASIVDENYFEVAQTPIIHGRAFTANDKEGAPLVAIVNQQFTDTYWPHQDAIGKRLQLKSHKNEWAQIVGITRTGKYLFIGESPMPFLYLPFAQTQATQMVLYAETMGDPASAVAPLRQLVHDLDANQPVFNVRSLSDLYQQRAIAIPRIIMEVIGAMGITGLTLALIGLYGLVAYSVARRTREIGVRMAIGARASDILRMVLRQGLVLSVIGIGLGGLATVATARVLAAGLIGLGNPSPASYAVVPVVLLVVTLASCYLPARRAARVDPTIALRYE